MPLEGIIVPVATRMTVQIGTAEHLDIGGSILSFLNHHCEPNAIIDANVRPVVLNARRAIAAREEITFDYATTEWDMAEPFHCQCGSPACRGLIRGLRFLPAEVQDSLQSDLTPAMRDLLRDSRANGDRS
jgi:hypothetical protein